MKVFTITGLIIGLTAGFLYWYFIGCNTGTCAITGQWHTSSLYGAVMGGLLGNFSYDLKKKKSEKTAE